MIYLVYGYVAIAAICLIAIYRVMMGWHRSRDVKTVRVWSEDANRMDEHGGPYEVEIDKDKP